MADFPSSSSASGIWNMRQVKRAVQGGNWPTAGIFNTDSNAANLWAAMTFTTYRSATTGGAYVDVSSQIRTAQGQAAGTTRNFTSNGNGAINNTVASPFAQYTGNLAFANASVTSDLMYWASTQLPATGNLTVECRLFIPAATSYPNGLSVLHTNDFSGGYYQGYALYADSSFRPAMFTNYGSSVVSGTSITAGSWCHLAYVFTSGTLSIYLNGTRISSTGSSSSYQNTVAVGGTYWDGFGGAANRSGLRMQDFRVYTIAKYSGASFSLSSTNPDLGGAILS